MIDVNYLKRMNDVYGHEQGNLYLQNAAELIRGTFGDEHTYRIGGDEFVVILEGKAQEGAEEKIAMSVRYRGPQIDLSGQDRPLSAAVLRGIAAGLHYAESEEEEAREIRLELGL